MQQVSKTLDGVRICDLYKVDNDVPVCLETYLNL